MKSRGRRDVLNKRQPPEVTPVRGEQRKEADRFAVEGGLNGGGELRGKNIVEV